MMLIRFGAKAESMFHSLEAIHQAVTSRCPSLPSTVPKAPWPHPNVGRTGQVANDKMEGEDGCLDKMFFVMERSRSTWTRRTLLCSTRR